MGPQAHFANSSKCGVSRIASEPTSSRPIFPALLGKTHVRPAAGPAQSNTIVSKPTVRRLAVKRRSAPGAPRQCGLTVRLACLLENCLVRVRSEKDSGAGRGVRIPRWTGRPTGLVEHGDDEPVTARSIRRGCWALSGTGERTRTRTADDSYSADRAKHQSDPAHNRPPFPQPIGWVSAEAQTFARTGSGSNGCWERSSTETAQPRPSSTDEALPPNRIGDPRHGGGRG
jgi:hypothetical protein